MPRTTLALLALAKANVTGATGFNEPSPQDAVALHALVGWRRDAQHALRRIRTLDSGAPGRGLAISWLKALIAALDFQRQGLSWSTRPLLPPPPGHARKALVKSNRLEARLDRELT